MKGLLPLLLVALPPGTIYVPGRGEGGPGQTGCRLRSGIDFNRDGGGEAWGLGIPSYAMCPGRMSESCCCRWVHTAVKPECAGGDAGVPVS